MSEVLLRQVLAQNMVDTTSNSPVLQVRGMLLPVLQRWGGQYIRSIEPSGSFAKGTAVRSGTDIDLFVSLHSTTPNSLKEIYDSLFSALSNAGLQPRRQDVSVGLRLSGAYDVDVVPARHQGIPGHDHSLYTSRRNSWMQTNVSQHISVVRQSGRLDEIKLIKIWRNRRGLDFPSFFLELAVIRALSGRRSNTLGANVVAALEFLRDHLPSARIIDPANSNNAISETLTTAQKLAIAANARASLNGTWEQLLA
jgi:hypothetical protein